MAGSGKDLDAKIPRGSTTSEQYHRSYSSNPSTILDCSTFKGRPDDGRQVTHSRVEHGR